ncbi:MAG TPA: SGNH/GDSL hydrolase family protein [Elusimicrobiales bacterium]|nr:SGNH/GDSL hydrolase family protein [Elusimicrobiales bacterium]
MKNRVLILLCLLAALSLPASAANILFIGDSHSVGPFGWKMDELLRTVPGAKVGTYSSCGSIYQWWETAKPTPCGYFFRDMDGKTEKGTKGPTPIFDTLMKEVKPALVVVELGANYAGYESDDFAVNDMKKLVKKISDSGAACFWITKPDARKKADIPRILQLTYKAVTPYCEYFDSTLVTKYPAEGGDGVHYWSPAGTPIAKAWAEAAFVAMKPLLDKLPAEKP